MEEESVSIIRKSSRDLLSTHRKIQRGDEIDNRRHVKQSRLTAEKIQLIAESLKSKHHATVSELQELKNAIMDNTKYITTVLNVHGVLRGLVRDLTGQDAAKQLAAAGCLCNLALGDARACMGIAKQAGLYLTTELDSLNTELAVTCAWTLGNLAGSDSKVCNILISQGALAKTIDVLTKPVLVDAALYVLEHFTYPLKDELRPEYLTQILDALVHLDINLETSKVLFILSCHNDFPNHDTEILLKKLLIALPSSVEEYLTCSGNIKSECCQLLYIIRTLANMNMSDVILKHLISNNYNVAFKNVISMNNIVLNNSITWLLGNLYNYDSNSDFFTQIL